HYCCFRYMMRPNTLHRRRSATYQCGPGTARGRPDTERGRLQPGTARTPVAAGSARPRQTGRHSPMEQPTTAADDHRRSPAHYSAHGRLEEFPPRAGSGPLSGQLVVDFSRVLAGPYSTMMLADLGATVIKVEGPKGDDTRHWAPPVRDDDATYYLSVNRNKYDIVLDFADAEDLQVAQKLAARADIIVENFKPGGLKKFALDYDGVTESNPDVIFASVTGFGPRNPLPGYDLLMQAL